MLLILKNIFRVFQVIKEKREERKKKPTKEIKVTYKGYTLNAGALRVLFID